MGFSATFEAPCLCKIEFSHPSKPQYWSYSEWKEKDPNLGHRFPAALQDLGKREQGYEALPLAPRLLTLS